MRRSHKKLDPDVKALGVILRGCKASSPRMVAASLKYAWDKYVVHAAHQSAPKGAP